MEPLKLSDLTSLIQGTLKEAFPSTYWVIAEISDLKVNFKGHCYINLVEKDDSDALVAQIRTTVWQYQYRIVSQKFKEATGEDLKDGMKILASVSVAYHQVYGLSLNIKDIDPSYTLGEMARKRKEIIDRLKKEGLLEKNETLELPLVPQRLAVISSETAAGYLDFNKQLSNNSYGYRFDISLFPAVVQGDEAEKSIVAALNKISESGELFDVVIIIRGGGSQLDLSCFDSYEIAKTVALLSLPVITGIGHEKDETVTDMAAHTKLKTPTAVAEFIISGARSFEERVLDNQRKLITKVRQIIADEKNTCHSTISKFIHLTTQSLKDNNHRLNLNLAHLKAACRRFIDLEKEKPRNQIKSLRQSAQTYLKNRYQNIFNIISNLKYRPSQLIAADRSALTLLRMRIKSASTKLIQDNKNRVSSADQALRLLDPVNILKRGYSVTMINGHSVKDPATLTKGDKIESKLFKGTIISAFENIKEEEND